MSIEDTIKSLRAAAVIDKDGIDFVADQLEQLQAENEMLKSGNKQIIEDYKLCITERDKLKSENKRLKVEKPVRCGECVNLIVRHYEDEGEKPYIKYGCKYRGSYQVHANDFCSYGERRDAE